MIITTFNIKCYKLCPLLAVTRQISTGRLLELGNYKVIVKLLFTFLYFSAY
jgi:hypothetical protein